MKGIFRCVKDAYVKFVEKQGFPIIVTVCVAVITATAIWTGQPEEPYVAPTPPVGANVSAAQLLQQSLREVATATPVPTASPRPWVQPLEEYQILQPFSTDQMVQSANTGIWAIHDAIDLQGEKGALVHALSDGTVIDAGHDQLHGFWLHIDHGDGYEALYAGMALAGSYIKGDDVEAGAVIGFVGNGLLHENHLEPHLHLQMKKDGQSIDPCSLWTTSKSSSDF